MAERPPVVAPALFQRVVEYSTAMSRGEVAVNEPMSNTTPIVVFCENFFAQFLRHTLKYKLVKIGTGAKQDVVRSRMKKRLADGPAASLVAMFEDACDMWSDVLGRGYGVDPSEIWWTFHEAFLVQLFDAIVVWTSSLGDEGLHEAAVNGRDSYVWALEGL